MNATDFAAKPNDSDAWRRVFVRWERWRIAYNLALAAVVVTLALAYGGNDFDWRRFAGQCTLGALVGNICYLAGPTAEVYLRWLGLRHRAIAPLLFVCGLLLAAGLAAATVTASIVPF
jgi:hypothetical protein